MQGDLLFMLIHIIKAYYKLIKTVEVAACRKTITRKWLKPERPTVDEWIDIVYDIFKMEEPLP